MMTRFGIAHIRLCLDHMPIAVSGGTKTVLAETSDWNRQNFSSSWEQTIQSACADRRLREV